MDEHELQERLRTNPSLRRLNPELCNTDHTRITRNTSHTDPDVLQEAEAMLESHLQNEARRIALANNYLFYHTYRSKRSEPGFPDAVLLRVGLRCELYFVEFKRQAEEPTDKQKTWLAALAAFVTCAGGFVGMRVTVNVFIWRPMDLLTGRIEEILRGANVQSQPLEKNEGDESPGPAVG